MVFATLAVTGCASDPGQTITGRVNAGSFPEAVTQVRAVGSTSTVSANVAADGSFLLRLPAGERYRIELISSVRASDLLFPRAATSTLDTSFYIAASGAAFDLGAVTYVKDPESSTTIFDQGGGGGEDGGGGGGDTGTGGGGDTGTGGGGDTGTGGGEDGGAQCGAEAAEPDGAGVRDDGAVAEHTPDQALNCSGDGDGGGGGGDEGGGGQDTGGGGQDSGGGGGG